jgi:prepilin-type processing-associated H-X9-DG protein
MFDGLRFLDADFKKVNARHNRQKLTNFLMADGHAETIETARLPRGPGEPTPRLSQAQINGADLNVWSPWPYPKWRIDQ